MTPKQVLEWILMDLETERFHSDQLHAKYTEDRKASKDQFMHSVFRENAERCDAQSAGLTRAIEIIRARGARILHADDLTQHDEKEAHRV